MKVIECKTYTIHINSWDALDNLLSTGSYSSVMVIVDENTFKYCLPLFDEKFLHSYEVIVTESGEQHKNLESCQKIWQQMVEKGVDRHSLCINLGGGVIGDMGGFSAATFMRGMDFVQIPTSLLSQVDASVGGKLGIDFNHFKNLIGVIQNPNAVFIFTDFLKTLPYKHLLSGFAEVLKHGLIKDKSIFESLTAVDNLSNIEWERLVYESVMIKKSITEEDPYEKGLRKILNFGHTLGHAIESHALASQTSLLHGEAIAIGMIMETHLSHQKGWLSEEDAYSIKEKIIPLFGHHPHVIPDEEILISLMAKDKKNKGGTLLFSLLSEIGHAIYDQKVTNTQIKQAVQFYKA